MTTFCTPGSHTSEPRPRCPAGVAWTPSRSDQWKNSSFGSSRSSGYQALRQVPVVDTEEGRDDRQHSKLGEHAREHLDGADGDDRVTKKLNATTASINRQCQGAGLEEASRHT